MESPIILYDRSRTVADWKCGRARLYGYEMGGLGYASDGTHLELYIGTTVHDGLAAIARGVSIDEIADAAAKQIRETLVAATENEVESENFAMEQSVLVEGMLRGFHKQVWPTFIKQYPEVVAIEQEMVYEHNGLTFMSKPDLIVRDKEGQLWYVEYKTTSSNKEQWVNSWSTAVQLHSSVRAVEASLGEAPVGVIVQGLYKGYVTYNKQTSPFCYAYHKAGNPPFTKDYFSYEYAAGLKKYPTWQMAGGVKAWVAGMPEAKLAEQFVQVPPIFINDALVDAFFRQRAERELEISVAARAINDPTVSEAMKLQVMDMTFQQKFESCYPAWGKPCAFRKLCFGHVSDPLTAGFVVRAPHHQPEVDKYKEASDGV